MMIYAGFGSFFKQIQTIWSRGILSFFLRDPAADFHENQNNLFRAVPLRKNSGRDRTAASFFMQNLKKILKLFMKKIKNDKMKKIDFYTIDIKKKP